MLCGTYGLATLVVVLLMHRLKMEVELVWVVLLLVTLPLEGRIHPQGSCLGKWLISVGLCACLCLEGAYVKVPDTYAFPSALIYVIRACIWVINASILSMMQLLLE